MDHLKKKNTPTGLPPWIALLLATSVCFPAAQAKILEIHSFEKIITHIQPNTLLVLDLDNTVIEPHQTLGGDEWFSDLIRQNLDIEKNRVAAVEAAAKDWMSVQLLAPMKPVEANTPSLIRKVQAAGNLVIGLTARSEALAERTVEQLHELGICFMSNPVSRRNAYLDRENGLRYHEGILFVGERTTKGEALLKFLDHHKFAPPHVIFVDDRRPYTESVESALESREIDHVIFRYGATDSRAKTYRRDIAELQWQHFKKEKKIISDEEARKTLK